MMDAECRERRVLLPMEKSGSERGFQLGRVGDQWPG